MIYALPDEFLARIIKEAVGVGEMKKAIELGSEPKFISLNKAYKRYGRGNVDCWIRQGVVRKYKDSTSRTGSVRVEVMQLESAAYSINVSSKLSPLAKAEMVEIITSK